MRSDGREGLAGIRRSRGMGRQQGQASEHLRVGLGTPTISLGSFDC